MRLRTGAQIADDLEHVDDRLQLYAEHTWGSWETYSKPHSTFSHSHHNAKSGFAYDAFDHARDLAIEGWYRAVHAPAAAYSAGDATAAAPPRIVVVNGAERPRREVVDVEVDKTHRVRALVDAPPFGVAMVAVPEVPSTPPTIVESPVTAGRYRVSIDPARGGVVSLVHLPTGRELVDPDAPSPLGAVVVEVIEAGSEHPMITESPKLFHPDFPGPRFERHTSSGGGVVELSRTGAITRLVWRGSAPGIPEIVTTLSIADDHDDVDLDVWLSKPEKFGPESILVTFPFRARGARFLAETAGAVFHAGDEQLPDTSKDWYSIQHAVGVVGDGEEHGVLWGTRDAPLVQLGGIHTGVWARELDVRGGEINSWLMNNLHFTNFQARQEVTRVFRYRLRPAEVVDRAAVRVYGRDLLEPLQARHYAGPLDAPASPPLRVTPADDLLVELSPHAESDVRVTLRNITDRAVEATIAVDAAGWSAPEPVKVAAAGSAVVILRREPSTAGA